MGDIEMFATNVGGIDRILRIVVGLALIAWFFMDQGTGFWHWAKLIGIVPLATGLMSSCPLYSILGLNTCPVKRA
jgi:drug/metabolite transporter (DMT)-like permease